MSTAATLQSHHESVERPKLLSERHTWVLAEWRRLVGIGFLLALDWLTLFVCLCVVWAVRTEPLREAFPSLDTLFPLPVYVRGLYFFVPWIAAFVSARLYTRRLDFWDEARWLVRATTLGAALVLALSFAEKPEARMSRVLMAGVWLLTLPALPLARYFTKTLLWHLGLWSKRVLIVGAGAPAVDLRRSMQADRYLGYAPVAFVDDRPIPDGEALVDGLPVVGPFAALPQLIHRWRVRDVVIAIPEASRAQLLSVVSACEGHVETVRLMPDTIGLASVGVDTEQVGGQLLLGMRWNLAKPWNTLTKRAFDVVLAGATLLVLAPLLALIALAIRLDSPGPVLLTQRRVGRGGSPFGCYKFRTMHCDNQRRLEEYLRENAAAREEWERYAKLRSDDPRVTRVGRFLRRFSLDELPQLLNVVRDQMSLVGPRPYLPEELEGREAIFRTILKASPGITGLWQVSGRNRLTMAERQRLDEYYVRNWSLWTDVTILLRTIAVVLTQDGAY